ADQYADYPGHCWDFEAYQPAAKGDVTAQSCPEKGSYVDEYSYDEDYIEEYDYEYVAPESRYGSGEVAPETTPVIEEEAQSASETAADEATQPAGDSAESMAEDEFSYEDEYLYDDGDVMMEDEGTVEAAPADAPAANDQQESSNT